MDSRETPRAEPAVPPWGFGSAAPFGSLEENPDAWVIGGGIALLRGG